MKWVANHGLHSNLQNSPSLDPVSTKTLEIHVIFP